MRRLTTFAVIVMLMSWCAMGEAAIIDFNCNQDGDGAIDCIGSFDDVSTVTIVGDHKQLEPGHMGTHLDSPTDPLDNTAYFETDDPQDPTITFSNSIDNDTSVAWAGYQVDFYMEVPFTIDAASITAPADWTYDIGTVASNGQNYVGRISYTAGTPLPVGGTLDFDYTVSFDGATFYKFCQEMTPVAVPEPGTLLMLTTGVFGLCAVARRRRQ